MEVDQKPSLKRKLEEEKVEESVKRLHVEKAPSPLKRPLDEGESPPSKRSRNDVDLFQAMERPSNVAQEITRRVQTGQSMGMAMQAVIDKLPNAMELWRTIESHLQSFALTLSPPHFDTWSAYMMNDNLDLPRETFYRLPYKNNIGKVAIDNPVALFTWWSSEHLTFGSYEFDRIFKHPQCVKVYRFVHGPLHSRSPSFRAVLAKLKWYFDHNFRFKCIRPKDNCSHIRLVGVITKIVFYEPVK